MRKVFLAVVAVLLAWSGSIGTAHALVGTDQGGRTKYAYNGSTSPDSGSCGNDWANDVADRRYFVYDDKANDGSYRVKVKFNNGTFTTVQGDSPGKCDSGNSNLVSSGITGTFGGFVILKVTGEDGTWTPTKDVNCASADCFISEFVSAAFGPSATYSTPDFFFSYTTTNALACLKHWVNAGTGNSGDIATICT
jgi:hypothetical protein